jgi:hypothetical protein
VVGPPQAVTSLGKDMTQFLPLFSGLQDLYIDFDIFRNIFKTYMLFKWFAMFFVVLDDCNDVYWLHVTNLAFIMRVYICLYKYIS